MSSKIYFKQTGGVNLRRGFINVASRLHHRIAPAHAKQFAKKLLLTPVRSKKVIIEPEGLVRQSIETSEGKIMTYRLGSGPTWVLGHGWSGSSSQFFPLMEYIAQAGYTALAFDNPAHGESEGQFGHLPGFVAALDGVLEQQDAIAGIVAHSMGGAMVLESRHLCLESKPVLLVAPVLNYAENLMTTVERSGFSMKLFQEVIDEIAVSYQYELESINPLQRLQLTKARTVIVHDKADKFASFSESELAGELSHVTLIATEGLGHGRILKSEQLRQGFDLLARA
ncbi:alpha/beta hydrolase [Photobacterium sanguinicancri]|uniref:Alpha/beta fold hydrolase n=1 Tax=Photobacterium sanguinicancri TaxID=875932 RepID=A0AAW7Y2L9_9GAMM|nr:alpha/beta fold hydrolase [Photobacterium sanguinicancri]MDO6541188.1 alpha/beta fold hydrolase [Photobacterium sanguinicancri]OZS44622.1 alpha/beta hydrolase [Photobacterium sanguinicancri]